MSQNIHWAQRRQAAVPVGVASMHGTIFAAHAENATITDEDGEQYIDFAGGIAVLNTGHRHPKVMDAVMAQMQKFTHTAFQVNPYRGYVELAERLNRMAPGSSPKKTLLMTTGAEAVENAVKIARYATKRHGIIAFDGGFHGRTLMTMGLTGKTMPYKAGLGPMPAGIYHAPYPMPLHGISDQDSLDHIHRLFKADIAPEEVAAIILEPVQGEGGFYAASREFFQQLRKLCDEHGILLIADEVQSGAGRTGKFFAVEHAGIEPDFITLAKSMAGGFPLSAVIGRADIMDAVPPGGLGGTYGGSPIGCAAALAVLDCFDEGLLEQGQRLGQQLMEQLRDIAAEDTRIADVRGLGAMVAIEFMQPDGTPDTETPKQLVQAAAKRRLILLSCGLYANVIRILVPLTANKSDVQHGINIIKEILNEQ